LFFLSFFFVAEKLVLFLHQFSFVKNTNVQNRFLVLLFVGVKEGQEQRVEKLDIFILLKNASGK